MSPRDLTVGDLASSLSSRGLVATGGRVTLAGIAMRVRVARSLGAANPWRERFFARRLADNEAWLGHVDAAFAARIEAHVLDVLCESDPEREECPGACRGRGAVDLERGGESGLAQCEECCGQGWVRS